MNWQTIISELKVTLTFQQIADLAGMSKGQVHDLGSGASKTVIYETGCKILDVHRKVMRRRPLTS